MISSGEQQPVADRITSVVTSWLQQEIKNSDTGRNGYLSDFDIRISDFEKPFNAASGNYGAAKALSHFGRMNQLAATYKNDMLDSKQTAKMLHHGLMFVSGRFETSAC